MQKPRQILQVNTSDAKGGAEKIAFELFRAYDKRDYDSWMVVGEKKSDEPKVLVMPNVEQSSHWTKFWWGLHDRSSSLSCGNKIALLLRALAEPTRLWGRWRGHEDFSFPGTRQLLNITGRRPDLIHGHNLHGSYFDLRLLPLLSRQVPFVLTLHDAWLLSGHCGHSFECERWKTGCGDCPDLTIYPAIRRDATAYNWNRKKNIYQGSRLHVITPCRWLMDKVESSILANAVQKSRVIPNGVNLDIFQPGDKSKARFTHSIPQDATVLLFAANGIRHNIWKDYKTLRAAVAGIAERWKERPVLFIALGENGPVEQIGGALIRFEPYQSNPLLVAQYYQAADIYLHAARADTFPTTVIEALACGTPTIGTAVGGIPEQIKGLKSSLDGLSQWNRYDENEATGILVPAYDAMAMTEAINLLGDSVLRSKIAKNAERDARQRFDVNNQVNSYLEFYEEIWSERAIR